MYADNARKIKSARSHLQAEQSLQARINTSSSWIPWLRESEKILSRRSLVLGCYYKFFVHISSCLSGGRCIVMTWSTKRQPKCQANIFLGLPILWIYKTMLAFCISKNRKNGRLYDGFSYETISSTTKFIRNYWSHFKIKTGCYEI